MTSQNFADLRVHSHYSYRDGVSSIEELVARAVELGRPAMALTDHDSGAGFVQLQNLADKYELANPIFGLDATLTWPEEEALAEAKGEWAGESCGAEAERLLGSKPGRCYNLTLLAQDQTGLHNLLQLLSWSGTHGQTDYGPRLTEEILLERAEGLMVLTGGPGGKLARLLAAGRQDEANKYTDRLHEAFGDRLYLEIFSHEGKVAQDDRARLAKFGQNHKLPLVATSDVHYVKSEQAKARDLLWAVADNVRLDDPKRRRHSNDYARPLDLAELERILADYPEAITNAGKIAASCRARLPQPHLIIPDFAVPQEFGDASKYLAHLAEDGLKTRLGSFSTETRARLEYELGVIERAGFSQYILIVADIVRQAHALGILCAPRGSSAGSLVCYAVGITPLNPLDYGLLFERFLNPDRLAPPDIDLDIADEERPRLIDYVVRKYGQTNVAHIITHNFEGAKSALRDAGKALGSDPIMVNRLVGLVPIEFQKPYTLARTLDEEPETAKLYKDDKAVHELYDAAALIEGTGRNNGTHAAGVVITPDPIAEYAPLTRTEGLGQQYQNSDLTLPDVMTQWDMDSVEKRGLLKVDLLGLTAWTAIGNALAFIKQEQGRDLDIWSLPTDDEATYKIIAQGFTLGVFQLEKPGMTEFARGMKPQSIQDIAVLIAAYRPGPMPFLGRILAVRNGREKLEAPHPMLEPILAESYGAPVYQETMLKIAREVAGYSLGEADMLRRAIGKKLAKEMAVQEQKFTAGAVAHGLTEKQAAQVWQMFPPFAYYGFNQAHAIIYGYLSYLTAYLKTHYPLEFLAALMSVAGGDMEATVKAVSECRRLGVPLLGPDINRSDRRITIDRLPDGSRALRLGLETVKGLGPTGLDAIMAARKDGDFAGLGDFVRRVPGRAVNARTLSALAKVGAFPFGNRAQMEATIPAAQKAAKAKAFVEPMLEDAEETPLEDRLSDEYTLLGVHITPIPVEETVARLQHAGRITSTTLELAELTPQQTGKPVKVGGAVVGGREVTARFGQMFTFNLNDGRGMVEVTVMPKLYREQAALLKEGRLLVIEGKPEIREGRTRLQATRLETA